MSDINKLYVDLDDSAANNLLMFKAMLDGEVSEKGESREGRVANGRVIEVTEDTVLIDIGAKSEGRVDADEFRGRDGLITIKPGDVVEVYVESEENEGTRTMRPLQERGRSPSPLGRNRQKVEADEIVRGRIHSRVKGGLHVDIGVKAFLPGSQVELRPTRNLDKFIDQEFDFKIIKFNKKRGNIVLSRRALL